MPVSIDRIVFSKSEYRTAPVAEDTSVKTKDALATELTFNTLIDAETDASTFGSAALTLRQIGRTDWVLSVPRDKYAVRIGDTITLNYLRHGMSGGKNFIVKRIKYDMNSQYTQYTLFGPQ